MHIVLHTGPTLVSIGLFPNAGENAVWGQQPTGKQATLFVLSKGGTDYP